MFIDRRSYGLWDPRDHGLPEDFYLTNYTKFKG
ncbi:uncharacterized protein [Blastocystis hominis]|uniref:Uncharacterized protein n=1 Tax=Blastocystis hominis TaxID=12968 RepID=D8M455_BLAHO|nr:uncharacterized protein [Blastocystis hominis]CBK22844.2 unnamed protein product [Blastocystis hominis]|eukprot:XP_012896892.1 uncharacterized protein [Blastocystis hominis]